MSVSNEPLTNYHSNTFYKVAVPGVRGSNVILAAMVVVFDLWLHVPLRVVSCRNFSHITDVSFRIYTFGYPLQLYSHYFL